MAFISRARDVDARAWSAATWATPFVTQLLLALVVATSWMVGKVFVGAHGALLFLSAAAVVLIVSAATCGALLRSASPRARGVALSVAGSYVVVFLGGIVYGFWVLRW
jgi:hypothetical protein